MKIVGTNEEVGRFLCALWTSLYDGFMSSAPKSIEDIGEVRIHDGLIGTYCGVKIEVEITKNPMRIGIITSNLTKDEMRFYVDRISANHSGVLYVHASSTKHFVKCCDDSTIESLNGYRIRGYKFDELWMDSLPSNWDEFDLCMNSVIGDRNKIHFFKELENETT